MTRMSAGCAVALTPKPVEALKAVRNQHLWLFVGCVQAARYQMIIMFIISSTTSVSAVACLVSTRCAVTVTCNPTLVNNLSRLCCNLL